MKFRNEHTSMVEFHFRGVTFPVAPSEVIAVPDEAAEFIERRGTLLKRVSEATPVGLPAPEPPPEPAPKPKVEKPKVEKPASKPVPPPPPPSAPTPPAPETK